jgi:hypothetical protein
MELIRTVSDDGTVSFAVSYPTGSKVLVKCEPVPHIRSLNANRHYFGAVLRYISDHVGEHPEELHEMFKLKFNPKEVTDPTTGEIKIVGGSTAGMTSGEFSEYVAKVMDVATALGIRLPTIDQYWDSLSQKEKL